jgi:hypothetical protein
MNLASLDGNFFISILAGLTMRQITKWDPLPESSESCLTLRTRCAHRLFICKIWA